MSWTWMLSSSVTFLTFVLGPKMKFSFQHPKCEQNHDLHGWFRCYFIIYDFAKVLRKLSKSVTNIRMLTTSLYIVNQAYLFREKVSGAEKIIKKKMLWNRALLLYYSCDLYWDGIGCILYSTRCNLLSLTYYCLYWYWWCCYTYRTMIVTGVGSNWKGARLTRNLLYKQEKKLVVSN